MAISRAFSLVCGVRGFRLLDDNHHNNNEYHSMFCCPNFAEGVLQRKCSNKMQHKTYSDKKF
jgi:hypothetical protein